MAIGEKDLLTKFVTVNTEHDFVVEVVVPSMPQPRMGVQDVTVGAPAAAEAGVVIAQKGTDSVLHSVGSDE